ncbi:MAG: asparaginyl/glutamyl-tRNA amidotransferase subunit C [Candidatus Moranbacteria bacterium RBG_19FT_COMBO_42_6]|nr:MAG: asparaginyl/glutamyl-tRNA amidotransferase subunit C [Candidatus Moranbacteria bacterium RBG_19FT_COMBO_42_6]
MISKKEVKHIAGLARIGVSEKEIERFSKDLSAVLDWIKELQEVDVEGVEATAHISGAENVTREDKSREFLDKDKIVKLFPEEKDGYGKVKSIL